MIARLPALVVLATLASPLIAANDPSLAQAIAESRLAARPVEDASGHWWMQNPRHGLNARFSPDGLSMRVEGSGAEAKTHFTRWITTGIGFGETLATLPAGLVAAEKDRVEIRRPGLVEWYVNTQEGLEHGYTLSGPPLGERGDSPLRVEMSLEGDLSADVAGDHVVLRDAGGAEVLRYAKLKVWDATGRVLVSRMSGASRSLAIEVEDAGAAYPITIDPIFSQQAYLKAFNAGSGDNFGTSVAIDGDYAVVGSPDERGSATTVNGPDDDLGGSVGAAYVFFRENGVWSQQAYLKASILVREFGERVAISGNRVLVGDDSLPLGHAFVFSRSGFSWTEEAILQPLNPGELDGFGSSVALDGDTALVGAPSESGSSPGVNGPDNNDLEASGAAYVFVRNGGVWTQQAYLKASNPGFGEYFGEAVSISGNTAVIGADDENGSSPGVNGPDNDDLTGAGAAYVFVRDGAVWTQQAYLKASNPGEFDRFGRAVAISGDTLVVGAEREDGSASGVNGPQNDDTEDSGAAYVFTRTGTTWQQEAYLKPSNTGTDDEFGATVAIDGSTVLVGAEREDGDATGVNGNQNDLLSNSGAAYLFYRSKGIWAQLAYLKASNTGENDSFGYSVDLDGGTALVGADSEDGSATTVNGPDDDLTPSAGAAYVFEIPLVDDPDNPGPPVVAPGYLSIQGPGEFPRTRIFRRSRPQILQITNSGGTPVTGITLSLRGRQAPEFLVGRLSKTTLNSGETANVPVVFRPWSRARYQVIGTARSSAAPVSFGLYGRGL